MPIRIVIADDHNIVRSGLRMFLEQDREFEVVGEAATGPDAVREVEEKSPDVLVLDISMPGMAGPRVAEGVLGVRPRTAIVVLTMHDDPYYVEEMLRIGVRGFVLKRSRPTDLVDAIRAVHQGGHFVEPVLAGAVIAPFTGHAADEPTGPRLQSLSPRERQVLELITLGHTNADIAEKLNISKRTVETHRNRIHSKLGIKGRAGLVRFAIEHKLIDVT